MIVHQVGLRAYANVLGEKDIETAAESVESSPIRFLAGWRQFVRDGSGEGIGGVWDGLFVDGPQRGPDKQREVRKVAIGKLRADRESLRRRMSRHR